MVVETSTGKRAIAARLFDAVGMRRLMTRFPAWSGMLVLNYHRLGSTVQLWSDQGVFSATQDDFEAQVRFLSKEFDLIRVSDIEDVLAGRCRRGVLITFDDGYRDNYEIAFPVLQALGQSALFFLTSGFLDHDVPAWWDELAWIVRSSPLSEIPPNNWIAAATPFDEPQRERAVKRLLAVHKEIPWSETMQFRLEMRNLLQSAPYPRYVADDIWMTWDMVREMHVARMEFGGHTVTHPVLSSLSKAQQRAEIVDSKLRIETELGLPISAFSYPVGQANSFTEDTQQLLQEANYQYGFSFMGGISASTDVNRFALPRFAIELGTDLAIFRAMVTLPQLFAR